MEKLNYRSQFHLRFYNSFSDHNFVGIYRKGNTKRFQSKTVTVCDYKNYNIEALKQDLNKYHGRYALRRDHLIEHMNQSNPFLLLSLTTVALRSK